MAVLGQRFHNARVALVAGTSALVVVAGIAVGGPASASPQGPHQRQMKPNSQKGPAPLVYGGGKVLNSSQTYAIWWGKAGDFPSDAEQQLPNLLDGFGGSRYLDIAKQYMEPTPTNPSSTFEGSLFDSSAPPTHSPAVSTIVNEVATVLAAKGEAPVSDGIYVVYTSNFPHLSYCAYHAAGIISGVTVQVAYVPNATNVPGCLAGSTFGSNTFTPGTDAMADSTAHEFMESVTDPVPPSGWVDKNGQEIGDKCNFVYGSTVTLHNGSTWEIQEEWSNADNRCIQGA